MRLAGYFSLLVTLAQTTYHGKELFALFLLMSRDSGDYFVRSFDLTMVYSAWPRQLKTGSREFYYLS